MTFRGSKGFTLIELLVVISIVSLMSSVALSALNSARDRAKVSTALRFATGIDRALGADAAVLADFDEGSGTGSLNKAGGNNVVLNGASWSTDTPFSSGNSLSFPGTLSAYVTANPDIENATDEGANFTYAAWFKPAGLPISTNDGYIVLKAGFHSGLYHRKSDGRVAGIQWFSDTTATSILGPTLEIGRWYHLAFVVDSVADTLALYVDGALIQKVSYSVVKTLRDYGSGNFQIGGNSSYYAYGLIDGARLFTRALVAKEVGDLYAEAKDAHIASN